MSAARFPFSAVVGHDDLRLALLLNAIHPGVGGVLVRGEKGTAKSTAVRALVALLPDVEVVRGCRFGCAPDDPDPTCPDGPHDRGAPPRDLVAALPRSRTAQPDVPAPHVDPAPPATGGVVDGLPRLTVADDETFDLDDEDDEDDEVLAAPEPASVRRPARLVELPVGATEDRLVGSLDLERALSAGERRFQPGLLAEANRGVLYVDEVNLLHDHLVDLLLDAAAMGRAHIERDGESISHAARFLLVGTMNPEEGELRPQLLDRFGLTVEVRASRDVGTRTEVMRRRIAFEDDPAAFTASFADAEADTARRIADAQARVGTVRLDDRELRRIAFVCARFDVDGMRADLVMARTAAAHAAWRGADAVTEDDVRVAARLALPHRRRRDPFDEPGLDEKDLEDALRDAAEHLDDPDPTPPDGTDGAPEDDPSEAPDGSDASAGDDANTERDGADAAGGADGGQPRAGANGHVDDADDAGSNGTGTDGTGLDDMPERRDTTASTWDASDRPDGASDSGGDGGEGRVVALGAASRLRPSMARRFTVPGLGAGAPGRRSRARTDTGRVVRPTEAPTTRAADLHVPATVLAAAPHQWARGRRGPGLVLDRTDLRHAEREGREGNLVLFVVDASGSMAARKRMTAVSGAVLGLLRDAYQRRDKVGLVTFRAREADVALPPTSSVPTAQARLARLRTGGRTPLADGLLRARRVLAVERLRDPKRRPLLVLLTDGRATVPARPGSDPVADARRAAALLGADGTHTVVVDCESGPVRLGLAAPLAAAAGGSVVTLDELTADGVGDVVRAARAA